MKLGEALSLRAKQAQKLNDLRGRIKANAMSQEGSAPAEDANALIEQYLAVSGEHRDLLVKIAAANARTEADKKTLLALLHEREDLIRQRNIYGMAATAASPNTDTYRYMRSELRYVASVDVADLRRKEEEVGEQVRVLDAKIQQVNWETDL